MYCLDRGQVSHHPKGSSQTYLSTAPCTLHTCLCRCRREAWQCRTLSGQAHSGQRLSVPKGMCRRTSAYQTMPWTEFPAQKLSQLNATLVSSLHSLGGSTWLLRDDTRCPFEQSAVRQGSCSASAPSLRATPHGVVMQLLLPHQAPCWQGLSVGLSYGQSLSLRKSVSIAPVSRLFGAELHLLLPLSSLPGHSDWACVWHGLGQQAWRPLLQAGSTSPRPCQERCPQ